MKKNMKQLVAAVTRGELLIRNAGLEHLRMTCANCGNKIITDHPHEETVNCPTCGVITFCSPAPRRALAGHT